MTLDVTPLTHSPLPSEGSALSPFTGEQETRLREIVSEECRAAYPAQEVRDGRRSEAGLPALSVTFPFAPSRAARPRGRARALAVAALAVAAWLLIDRLRVKQPASAAEAAKACCRAIGGNWHSLEAGLGNEHGSEAYTARLIQALDRLAATRETSEQSTSGRPTVPPQPGYRGTNA